MVDQSAIIRAGIRAIQSMDFLIGQILSFRPDISDQPGPPFCMVSDPIIPESIEALCHAQALAYSCLFDDGNRSSESSHFRKLRMARVEEFRKLLAGVNISNLRNRGFRNAVAHFDERFLKLLDKYPKPNILQDMGLSHKAAFNIGENPEEKMIRVVCFDENKIYLFGECIHIGDLRREGEEIIGALGFTFDRANASGSKAG